MIVTPMEAALGVIAAAMVGAFAHRLWLDHTRNRDSICPTCYGPLDEDGLSESWTARLEPAEGQVIVDPEDNSTGFLLLDDGRVGRVDVVPAEVMLLPDKTPMFATDEGGDQDV